MKLRHPKRLGLEERVSKHGLLKEILLGQKLLVGDLVVSGELLLLCWCEVSKVSVVGPGLEEVVGKYLTWNGRGRRGEEGEGRRRRGRRGRGEEEGRQRVERGEREGRRRKGGRGEREEEGGMKEREGRAE